MKLDETDTIDDKNINILFLILAFLFVISIALIASASAFGINNPTIPQLTSPTTSTVTNTFNNNTNSSYCWQDNCNTTSYVRKSGDSMYGALNMISDTPLRFGDQSDYSIFEDSIQNKWTFLSSLAPGIVSFQGDNIDSRFEITTGTYYMNAGFDSTINVDGSILSLTSPYIDVSSPAGIINIGGGGVNVDGDNGIFLVGETDINGNVTSTGNITAKAFCNSTGSCTNNWNFGSSTFSNTNIAYINTSQTFTQQNQFENITVKNITGTGITLLGGLQNNRSLVVRNATGYNTFLVDTINNTVGIGIAPQAPLHVSLDGTFVNTSMWAAGTDNFIFSNGLSSAYMRLAQASSSVTASGGIFFVKARGTLVTPLANSRGDTLSTIASQGYDGKTRRLSTRILAEVNGTPSDGTVTSASVPGSMRLQTANNDSGTLADGITIDSWQQVGIPQNLLVGANTTLTLGSTHVGQATCFLSGGMIGYCSDAVNSTGGCTCNNL